MAESATFDVSGEGLYRHPVGAKDCREGWCDRDAHPYRRFPRPCKQKGCDGLIHADFGDETPDCEYWLYTKCDKYGWNQWP